MNTPANMPQLRIAMVMAAGYGNRMGQLTRRIPKPMLPLNDHMRIIDVTIHKLANHGIRRVVVNTHYLADKLEAHLANGGRYGVELIISHEEEILGSGGGIAHAERYFEGEPIVVVNADVLCEVDIQALYAHHCRSEALATMTVLPSRNYQEYSLVLYDTACRLHGFILRKQDIPLGERTGIFTGHQILSAQARSYLRDENQSIIGKLYLAALDRGENLQVFPFEGAWIDIGTRAFYDQFVDDIRRGVVDLARFM